MTISRDEIEAARLTSELKYVLDNQSMRVSAKREGRAEGLQERGLEIAKNLKAAGVSEEIIYQSTGLRLADCSD